MKDIVIHSELKTFTYLAGAGPLFSVIKIINFINRFIIMITEFKHKKDKFWKQQ